MPKNNTEESGKVSARVCAPNNLWARYQVLRVGRPDFIAEALGAELRRINHGKGTPPEATPDYGWSVHVRRDPTDYCMRHFRIDRHIWTAIGAAAVRTPAPPGMLRPRSHASRNGIFLAALRRAINEAEGVVIP